MSEESSEDDSITKIKVVLLGESCVGKSALIFRFISDKFLKEHNSTVEEFYKVSSAIVDLKCELDIIDTAGNKNCQNMLDSWIINGNCYLLVYSINDANSFKELKSRYERICQIKENEIISIILVGNKYDLSIKERKVTEEEGKKYAESKNILFLETSALNKFNVKEVFDAVINDYLKKLYDKKNENGWCACF